MLVESRLIHRYGLRFADAATLVVEARRRLPRDAEDELVLAEAVRVWRRQLEQRRRRAALLREGVRWKKATIAPMP